MDNLNAVAVSRIPGLKWKERLLIAELFPDTEILSRISSEDISRIIGRKFSPGRFLVKDAVSEAVRILDVTEKTGIQVIWYWDREFPPQLREIYDPPVVLYTRGGTLQNSLPHIAVVGTRYPTRKGLESSFMLGAGFAEKGIPVVSGLALGIDSAVHRGVVEGNGKTVAVLGNGIDSVYPASNRKLAFEITDKGGVVLSEFPPGTPPLRYNFPKRNRIISGLSRSVVIVEAPLKSGALITADFALEQGRELFVHSCSLVSPRGEGALKLSIEGAGIVDSCDDILMMSSSGETGSMRILENVEDYSLSDLLSMELEGTLLQYEGTRFVTGGVLQ